MVNWFPYLYVRNGNYHQESKEGDSSESGNELTLLSGQRTNFIVRSWYRVRSDTQGRTGLWLWEVSEYCTTVRGVFQSHATPCPLVP